MIHCVWRTTSLYMSIHVTGIQKWWTRLQIRFIDLLHTKSTYRYRCGVTLGLVECKIRPKLSILKSNIAQGRRFCT